METKLLTISQVADSLQCGRTTVYEKFLKTGCLEVVKIGSSTRITARSLDKWIETQGRAGSQDAA